MVLVVGIVFSVSALDQVSILTWNVWFDTFCQQKRQLGLLLEVLHAAPDIVCFQDLWETDTNALLGVTGSSKRKDQSV
eukprot:4422561-Amphidinium_carterae.1